MKESFKLCPDQSGDAAQIMLEIELDFGQRQKSRHKALTRCGQELGWFLERGRVLQDGDILLCNDGGRVRVSAANETVSEVCSSNAHLLMRAAYHLGNRHVPLQMGTEFLRYQHDHVLDAMLVGLGLHVDCCQRPFHPENGAYHSQGKSGTHSHSHTHDHAH